MRELTPDDARHAVRGGGVLACGGGGWKHHGELMGSLATSLERPVLAGVDEVPADTWVATVTAIGAPAAGTWCCSWPRPGRCRSRARASTAAGSPSASRSWASASSTIWTAGYGGGSR